MLDSNTIIIVLLCILIFLYLLDMYKRDYFSGVAGTFFNVDYQTQDVVCDDLTGTYPCVVKTTKPNRKEVCNKKYNFISPNKRIGMNNINQVKTDPIIANELDNNNNNNNDNDNDNEMGMSLDDLYSNPNSFDDVKYELDELREKKNLKVKNLINSNKQNDTNTLSDVDEELMSLNN